MNFHFSLQETLSVGLKSIILPEGCHSCWLKSRMKEVASDLTVNQAEISVVLDIVKAIAVSDVFIEEHE